MCQEQRILDLLVESFISGSDDIHVHISAVLHCLPVQWPVSVDHTLCRFFLYKYKHASSGCTFQSIAKRATACDEIGVTFNAGDNTF